MSNLKKVWEQFGLKTCKNTIVTIPKKLYIYTEAEQIQNGWRWTVGARYLTTGEGGYR